MTKQLKEKGWLHIFSLSIIFLAWLVFSSPWAQAQEFPTKPIALVLGVGPGGSHDLPSRVLSSLALEYLGKPIMVQFKPGAGGAIASDFVASAPPDGYTLLFASAGTCSMNPAFQGTSKGPDDLTAICRINYLSYLICARSDAPFKTFKEMLTWAKENPGKLTYGHTGAWGAGDVAWKQIKLATGITTRDIPHDGAGPTLIALLGGNIMVGAFGSTTAMPQVSAGKLKVLAVLDAHRYGPLPNVPTVKEEGPDVVISYWQGILAPKATPRPIIDKLGATFKKMLEDPSFVGVLKTVGEQVNYLGPDEFNKLWRSEFESYKNLSKMLKK